MNFKRKLATQDGNKIFFLVTQFVLLLSYMALSTLGGMPSAQASPSGKSARFDGRDDYGSVPVIPPGPLPGGLSLTAFTVEAWIKPTALSARRSAEAAILRAAFIGPPDSGDIEASHNSFAMTLELNRSQASSEWGLKTCTPSCTDVTSAGDLTLEWQHLVATWDGSYVNLYRNGAPAIPINSQPLSGSMPPILHFVIGRLVASIYAEADEIAVWNFAFTEADAQTSYSCGVRAVESNYSGDPSKNLIAYWQFNPPDPTDNGYQPIIDSSGPPLFNGYRGASSAVERQDPQLVDVDYSGSQQLDTDFDGIPDGCDNCQYAYNPNQANSDTDLFGDACDSCPRTDNTDTDDDGVAEPCENVDELVVDVAGSRANICFEYTAAAEDIGQTLYFMRPTCYNTHITCYDNGNLVPPANRVPPPVGIVFTGDPPQVYTDDDTDVEEWTPSYAGQTFTRCVECDLSEMYHPNVLAHSGALTCEAAYSSSIQDSDAPTLWIGDSPQAEFEYPVQFVEINIKPTSYPNIINNSGGGKLPVAIYGTDRFDATIVDPHSLSLRPAGKPDKSSTCEPAQWSWTDIGSPGTTESQGPADGITDILVHFDQRCLQFTAEDTQGILEGRAAGTSITGHDEVLIFE